MDVVSEHAGPDSEVAWPRSVIVGVPILGLLFTFAILTATVFFPARGAFRAACRWRPPPSR